MDKQTNNEMVTKLANIATLQGLYKTNHILHGLLSLVSGGLWLPIWLFVAWNNSRRRNAMIKNAM
jgi:hypothetical protein